jgi:16S rRNA (guanine966-N2)-methyltransferase
MRITGGQAKGIPIKAPKGTQTRPTSDKVRQALFNVLGADVSGRIVLDLFAGSGALGIEALSRGAANAVLVDKDAASARAIELNLEKTGFSKMAEIIRADFRSALRMISRRGEIYGIVFIDPPYQGGILEDVAKLLSQRPFVARDAIIVVEHFKKIKPPAGIAGIPLADTRTYGQTCLSFFQGK